MKAFLLKLFLHTIFLVAMPFVTIKGAISNHLKATKFINELIPRDGNISLEEILNGIKQKELELKNKNL